MRTSVQLQLPPTEVKRLSADQESAGKKVDGIGLMRRALVETYGSQKAAAYALGITESQFSQQFSERRSEKHASLNRISDYANEPAWRRFAYLLCDAMGISVAGPDEERHALADVADAMARYLRVRR